MARKNVDWLSIVGEFIRSHPRTSASLAFQLGIIAAQAANKVAGSRRMSDIPGRLIELAPSISDLGGFLPNLTTGKKKKTIPKRRKKASTASRKKASS
jgi:hypothetical protein